MALPLEELHPLTQWQNPLHVQHTDGTLVADGPGRLEGGSPHQTWAAGDAVLRIYDVARSAVECEIGAEHITELRPAQPGYVIVVDDFVMAAEGPTVRTRG